ncbi:hypothetical protein [Mycolicibacterium brisbanense]|uniref:Succinyl-CoA ligase [ADP-forming] subunit alpha n=1 Tax=Mycolicibacterium brisbanense TaxID=146020 RepID=A0A100W6S9_9MYCO|nr:hypothetical protein [Mycolicibacterium brisbanense]GAS92650.1 succinyl-CoA ligase [ADP-forming] subunit alpha [Mycolicibacterium brisbanense]
MTRYLEPVTDWPPTTEMGPPMRGHSELPHFCGQATCGTNIPGAVNPLCGDRGPYKHFGDDLHVSCARVKDHDGSHSAFVFSINEPEEW